MATTTADQRQICRIVPQQGDPIEAYIQDKLSFSVASEWNAIMGVSGVNSEGIKKVIGAFTGAAFINQPATAKVWGGLRNFKLSLTLNFIAETNAKDDVLVPIARLMKFALPTSRAGYYARAPGPVVNWKAFLSQSASSQPSSLFDATSNPEGTIGLYVGTRFYLPSVVIESVRPSLNLMTTDTDGFPISASVMVDFLSYKEPFSGDIEQIFKLNAGDAPGNLSNEGSNALDDTQTQG